MDKVTQVTRIVEAVNNSAKFWGATIAECTAEQTKVRFIVCCVGHANNIVKGMRACGMVVNQQHDAPIIFSIRYPRR